MCKLKKSLFASLFAGAFLSLLPLSGNAAESPARIRVYLSGPAAMVQQLEKSFEAGRGDVLEMFHAGCGPLRQKVWTEVASGNVRADVFFGSNPLIYERFRNMGVLEAYESPEEKNLRDEYRLDHHDYTLVNARYQVFVFDRSRFKKSDLPTGYLGLGDEKWDGEIAYTDPDQSSTALALTCGLYGMYGDSFSFFEAVKKNHPLIVPKSKHVADKIQSGEMGIGIAPHDAVVRLNRKAKKEGFESRLGVKWPEEGALRIVRPITIMKKAGRSADEMKLCREFVDFMLDEGQKITAKFAFYPVRKDVAAPGGVPGNPKGIGTDWVGMEKKENIVLDGFKDVMSR